MTAAQSKGERTRAHVLDTALDLFRRRGFERTTMRDIARSAGLSLGAAYHYFPSKDDLVHAYYQWMQEEHERLVRERSVSGSGLEEKVRTLLVTKLDLLRKDRKLLAALFGNLGDPAHPLSLFGGKTAALRDRSIAQFGEAFATAPVPEEVRPLLGRALWVAHLGILLFFIHDRSSGQARTRKLVDGVVELAAIAVPLLSGPLAAPIRSRLLELIAGIEEPQ